MKQRIEYIDAIKGALSANPKFPEYMILSFQITRALTPFTYPLKTSFSIIRSSVSFSFNVNCFSPLQFRPECLTANRQLDDALSP